MTLNLENRELIEKYEKLGIELNSIYIELISRYKKHELTDLEWNDIHDIASRRGSELVDFFNINRKDIKEGFLRAADLLTDDNR